MGEVVKQRMFTAKILLKDGKEMELLGSLEFVCRKVDDMIHLIKDAKIQVVEQDK